VVKQIHEEGHAIGDFNHDNILIDPDGKVTLIDCDGYHITDGDDLYEDDTYYPRYSPPEGRGGNTLADVRAADRFCLGVHIFQFLMNGFHPYLAQGTEAENGSMEDKIEHNKFPYVYSNYKPIDEAPSVEEYENQLPVYLQNLFKQCFIEAGKDVNGSIVIDESKNSRPAISKWILPYEEEDDSASSGESPEDEDNNGDSENTETEEESDSSDSTDNKSGSFSEWSIDTSDNQVNTKSSDKWKEWDEDL
jgi:hypothetical protein